MLYSIDLNQGIRICSFDGGGPGVISELFILRDVMYRLQQNRSLADMPLPCEYAELMAGCGLGGFIAILLGRLRFTVDKAIETVIWFGKVLSRRYNDKDLNSRILKSELESLLKQHGYAENILMHDESDTEKRCKTFVCVTPTVTMRTCQRIRTYNSPLDRPLQCTVVEAALATMASPRHYSPVRIGSREFVGASLGYNNPTREAILEAWTMFGAETPVASVFSLGAGVSPPKSIEQSLQNPDDVLEDCERLANELSGQYRDIGIYFRLSVIQGLHSIHPDEWDPATIGKIESHTSAYLQTQTQAGADPLLALEEALHTRKGRIAIAAMNKAHTTPIYAKTAPLVSQYFVIREKIWERMTTTLLKPEHNKQIVLVMHGPGGSGKTQMVSYFVQQFRHNYVYIFYVDASSISSLQTDLTSAIRSLGVTSLHGTYKDALAFLSHTYGIRWLLIYDNADDPSVPLDDYFPQSDNGTIIVTTRNAQLSGLAPESSIEIGPMDEEEAVRALLRAAQFSNGVTDDDRVQARAIVTELGCLPVAIVQAGRFCSASRSLRNYLSIFRRQPRKLLERNNDRQQDRYRYPSAFAALSVSHKELSDLAKTLLHMLTFFHHSDIPLVALRFAVESNFEDLTNYIPRPVAHEEVLRRLNECLCPDGHWDDLHIQDMLDSLEKYSIISITKATTTQLLRFHPLTRVWAQSIIQEQDKVVYWSMAVQVLTSCSSKKHKRLRRSLLPHIHAVLDTPFPIHPNSGAAFARFLSEDGSIDKVHIWEDVRMRCIEVHGLENPLTVKATRKLANTLRETDVQRAEVLGLESVELSKRVGGKEAIIRTSRDAAVTFQKSKKWKEAGELLRDALDRVIALKGETSDNAMEISEDLALSHQEQGQWTEAEALRIRVLEVRRKNLQPEDVHVIEAMENLAKTYLQQGGWKEAAELQEHVLAVRGRLLGAAHPDTMSILADLAISYQKLGNWNDAATLQREILHNRRILLPEHHPDVLEAMANVAATYCNQGRWARAEELQREVMDARQKLLGKEHLDSVNAMDQLARTLVDMARWTEAEELQREVVDLRRRLLGPDHPETLTATRNLASNYSDQGRWKAAEKLERELVESMGTVMGPEHPDSLEAIGNLAYTLCQQGAWKEAENLQRDMVAVYERTLGREHPDCIVAMIELSQSYSELGQWLRAETLQVELEKTCRRVLGDQHPIYFRAVKELGKTYSNMGRWTEGKEVLQKMVKTMRSVMGEEHPETLAASVQLAAVYSGVGKWSKSEKMLKQLVETYRRTLGDEHPDTLTAITNLAMVYSEMGRWDDAEQMQIKTLETCRRVLGAEHPGTLLALSNLASTQSAMGRWDEAKDHQKRVLDVRRRIWGPDHPTTFEATHDLAATYSNMAKWAKAERLLSDLVTASDRCMGPEHPDSLASAIGLAVVRSQMGLWNKAEALRLVEVCERVLGPEHPDTLTAKSNLASTQAEMGQFAAANSANESILDARRRLLGDQHPDTLDAMAELAASYCQQARWLESELLLKNLVSTSKNVRGEEHPETLSAMGYLATTYSEMGRWAMAAEVQKEVAEATERLLGAEHPDTIKAKTDLASSLSELGHWTAAEALSKEVVKLSRGALGNRHPYTLRAMSNLATTYSEMGKWTAAEELQLEVLDIRRKMAGIRRQDSLMPPTSPTGQLKGEFETKKRLEGDEHPDTLIAMRDLASTYSSAGRWSEAEKMQTRLVESCRKIFGPEHPQTLTVIADLATNYTEMGKFKEAEGFQEELVEMRKRVLSDKHPDTIAAISDLAYTYSSQNRLEDAEKLQLRVVKTYQELLGDEHPDLLSAIGDLAATYSELNRLKEAEDLQIKMVEACRRLLGPSHPETLTAETNLSMTLCRMDRWEAAAQIQEKTLEVYRQTLEDTHPDHLSAISILAHTYTKLGRWSEAETLQSKVVDGWRKKSVGHDHPRYRRANSLLQEIRAQKKELENRVESPVISPAMPSSPSPIDQQPEAVFFTISEHTNDDGDASGRSEDGTINEGPGDDNPSAPPPNSSTDALIPPKRSTGCCECVIQ